MKKLSIALLLTGFFQAAVLSAGSPLPVTGALEAAGYPGWMSRYLSATLDASCGRCLEIGSRVEKNGNGGYDVILDGWVNIATDTGLEWVSRTLPERLEAVRSFFAYWAELGYDVDYDRDFVIAMKTVYARN